MIRLFAFLRLAVYLILCFYIARILLSDTAFDVTKSHTVEKRDTSKANTIQRESKYTSSDINSPSMTRNVGYIRTIDIKALSSRDHVFVKIDGSLIYERKGNGELDVHRGIHVIVLNQFTGKIMASRKFDTWQSTDDGRTMVDFLKLLQNGRIVILAIFDEAILSLGKLEKSVIKSFGSRFIGQLSFRNSWVFAYIKGSYPLGEDYHKGLDGQHGDPSHINVQRIILKEENTDECTWQKLANAHERKTFCSKYEGYGSLCDCLHPAPLEFFPPDINSKNIASIPIAVIASNRPQYLYPMLKRLLQTPGVKKKMVTVFIDGPYEEPLDVANILGVHVRMNPHLCDGKCGITQNYKTSLSFTFDMYPDAQYVIILEEDLIVSPDIMDYFSQLLPLLGLDDSIFCISAWNDQGYQHSSNDPSMLYRTETMPGLGWVLKRKIYKQELEPHWPKVGLMWDWDMWIRQIMLKNRECVIPDISRTYHFGKHGVHMNPYHHEMAFKTHALNNMSGVQFDISKLTKNDYEKEMHKLIGLAEVLDHTKSPCNDPDFIPRTEGHTYVFYIKFVKDMDVETWKNIAECFNIWHADVRGFHNGMFRLWMKKNKLFVVGSSSPYAVHKPSDVVPIFIPHKTNKDG